MCTYSNVFLSRMILKAHNKFKNIGSTTHDTVQTKYSSGMALACVLSVVKSLTRTKFVGSWFFLRGDRSPILLRYSFIAGGSSFEMGGEYSSTSSRLHHWGLSCACVKWYLYDFDRINLGGLFGNGLFSVSMSDKTSGWPAM